MYNLRNNKNCPDELRAGYAKKYCKESPLFVEIDIQKFIKKFIK